MGPFGQHFYDQPSARKGYWELEILGVHPARQGKGYASGLIGWGLQRARQEKVPAVVVMAAGLEGFYARRGFGCLVGYVNAEDVVRYEKDEDGELTEKRIVNPLKSRGIGGGGIAWTRTEKAS